MDWVAGVELVDNFRTPRSIVAGQTTAPEPINIPRRLFHGVRPNSSVSACGIPVADLGHTKGPWQPYSSSSCADCLEAWESEQNQ
jgi:hypothetical protein